MPRRWRSSKAELCCLPSLWSTAVTPDNDDPTNEPGIHTPWLYNALGQPWKTQQTVRTYLDLVYGTGPTGLPGNDDLGTMSAWYIWGALGLYPQTPSRGEMLLSSPIFSKVWIQRHDGPTATVTAPGATDDAIYIPFAQLDGQAHTRSWIPAWVLNEGGDLIVEVGAQPQQAGGSSPADVPQDR